MSKHIPIRIKSAALEDDGGRKILRGVIDMDSLNGLNVDDYQREEMPFSSLKGILEAIQAGGDLPDIELGMRGSRYQLRDGVFYLQDKVYIIDGLQRTTAAKLFMDKNPGLPVRLGVKVYFDTSKEWEREQFIILNTKRVRVSPDKIIFNRRETSEAVDMLYKLSTNDDKFSLYNKIAWSQRKGSKFLGAFALCKIMCVLHVHKVNGLSSDKEIVVNHLDRIMKEVGVGVMRDNVRTFFDLIDTCWGLRLIQHYEKAPQLKYGFLFVLARFLSDHAVFWRSEDKRLFVDVPLRKALRKFKIYEPTHAALCGSSGKALDELYRYIVDEVNKGKRGKRLQPRHAHFVSMMSKDMEAGADEPESEEAEEEVVSEAAE